MQFAKRLLMAFGPIALAAMILTVAAPKAVHATVAALVQVMNTAANPAITQDVSKLASLEVQLNCSPICYQIFPDAATSASAFSVPAGQSLVISTIQIQANGGGTNTLVRTNFSQADCVNISTTRLTWDVLAAGNRLVIQQVEAICGTPKGNNLTGTTFTVTTNGNPFQHTLLLGTEGASFDFNTFGAELAVHFYADPYSTLRVDTFPTDATGGTTAFSRSAAT